MPSVWLAAVVSLSTPLRGVLSLGVPAPSVVPDEVVYSDLAKSIAAGGFPSVRGVHELGWGVVYQSLIAPAWIVFDDPMHAYHAALIINALLMSLAAVPAYYLARMFVSERASVVVAAATVLVPSMAYTGFLLTENACYPAFLLAVLLVARALRSPSFANQAVALLGLGLLSLTRIQGIALAGGYLAAAATYAATLSREGRRAYLRRFLPTVSRDSCRGARADAPLDCPWRRRFRLARRAVEHVRRFPPGRGPAMVRVPRRRAGAVRGRDPGCGNRCPVRSGTSASGTERVRLFAALVLPTLIVMLVSVAFVSASIDVDGTENLNERYLFYVVPLLFVGLALWVEEGLPRPRRWAWVSLLASACLVMSLPIDRLVYNSGLQSVALLPWLVLPISGWALAVVVGFFTIVCGWVWLRRRARTPGVSGSWSSWSCSSQAQPPVPLMLARLRAPRRRSPGCRRTGLTPRFRRVPRSS